MVLSLFTIEILQPKCTKLAIGYLHLISVMFKHKNSHPYNLRLNSQFSGPLLKTVFHGTENISYLAPMIWNILPVTCKESPSLEAFKNRVKNGNLKTALPEFARHSLAELVLYKKYLDLF